MTTWLVRRFAASLIIIFAVVTLVFFIIHLAPGEPFLPEGESYVDPAVTQHVREEFGLDHPLFVQYVDYLRALAHGDLGESFAERRPVSKILAETIPDTLVLTGTALAIDLVLGLVLGIYQATHARRIRDVLLGYATLFLSSVPTFWLGLLALLVFGEWLHWVPIGGMSDPVVHRSLPWLARLGDDAWHLALPALVLGGVGAAGTARYQRAAMLEVIHQPFIRAARAKGVSEGRLVLVHALRNALLTFITLFGLSLPFLLTGAVLVETVFAWPGMGRLAAEAVFRRDYPVIMAVVIAASVMVVLGSAVTDLLYAAADPRIRVHDA